MENLNTLLFNRDELNNFIDKLTTYEAECCDYYHKYNETLGYSSPTLSPNAREVFVHRTLNKWFTGKYLVLYNTSNDITYRQYLYIMSISYSNSYDYSGLLHITLMDYNISQIVRKTVKFGELFYLEGEWCDSPHEHNKLLFMTSFTSIPEKEYIFEAFDMSKYPKRVRKGVDPMELIKIPHSILARTLSEAHSITAGLCSENLYFGKLIEIKKYEKE